MRGQGARWWWTRARTRPPSPWLLLLTLRTCGDANSQNSQNPQHPQNLQKPTKSHKNPPKTPNWDSLETTLTLSKAFSGFMCHAYRWAPTVGRDLLMPLFSCSRVLIPSTLPGSQYASWFPVRFLVGDVTATCKKGETRFKGFITFFIDSSADSLQRIYLLFKDNILLSKPSSIEKDESLCAKLSN